MTSPVLNVDFELYRGENKVYQITCTENGVVVDLTGATIRMAVRETFPESTIITDVSAIFTKTMATGITLTVPAAGQFEIEFKLVDTNLVEPATYYYGIEYLPQGAVEYRVMYQGKLKLNSDVSRP
jgi:hypothetical protein